MGYQNEAKRAKAEKTTQYDKLEIKNNRDEGFYLGGDKYTVRIIWNNLIGANMDNKQDHDNYLNFLITQNCQSATYRLVGYKGNQETVIETCEVYMPTHETRIS